MTLKSLFLILNLWRPVVAVTEQEVFKQAFDNLADLEKGYSDHPTDRGGKTRYGISSVWHPEIDIDHLAPAETEKTYFDEYWRRPGINKLISKPRVASKVFEMGVVAGQNRAIMLLQRALRSCTGKKLTEDGVLGPETESAFLSANEECLLVGLRSEMAGYFRSIVERDKSQQVFREGWLNRAYS